MAIPVACCNKYLIQVFPDPGNEAKAVRGPFCKMVDRLRDFQSIVAWPYLEDPYILEIHDTNPLLIGLVKYEGEKGIVSYKFEFEPVGFGVWAFLVSHWLMSGAYCNFLEFYCNFYWAAEFFFCKLLT